MCGIAGIHIFNEDERPEWLKMERAIDSLFSAINHRGGDATGFVAIAKDEVVWQKASCDAFDFYKERKNAPWGVRSVLLHTRMATQGSAAFPENNHPVRRGSVYVVHNGHIWNDREIFKKTNRERYGQVDSEAIAAIIAKYGIMRTHEAMEEVMGAAAIGVVDQTRPGLMVLARGSSSPLMFYRNENLAIFASTTDAIKRAWGQLYGTPPSDKKIEDVKEGTVLYLDGNEVVRKQFVPDDYYYSTKSNGYSHNYTGGKVVSSWVNAGTYADKWEWEDDRDDKKITILCSHGCPKEDCEICNPDDANGSFLPALPQAKPQVFDTQKQEWINAKECDICGNWFGEDELVKVNDWETKWLLCDTCCDEMSEVIADCDITRPTSIHDIPLIEDPIDNRHLRWFSADEYDLV